MLKGKDIYLRPLKAGDVERVNVWRNDLALIHLTQGIRFPKTLEMDKRWFDAVLNDMSNKNLFWGIAEISDDQLIGMVQLNSIDYCSGTAVWGIVIGETIERGKGFGEQALRLLFGYAFDVLNLRKISSYNIAGNEATFKVQDKIGGYVREGVLQKQVYFNGVYHDVIIQSLFRENYVNHGGR